MQVYYHIDQIPAFRNAVITIGTFDGVHLGHQKIIEQLKKAAIEVKGESVVISFHPHPRAIIQLNKQPVCILNTLEEKIELLEKTGINHLVIIPFTESFAQQSAVDYIKHFLVDTFHPHTIIIGYDHKFGRNREGDYKLLASLSSTFNFKAKEIPQQVLQEVSINSTSIREALLHHDVSKANTLLGYSYFFEGIVVEGNKKGRTIGFPTANLLIEDKEKLVPGDGVYAAKCLIVNSQWSMINDQLNGMMNIGVRPTVNGKQRTIEVHLFDFDENIYGKTLKIFVHAFLRNEQKFDGLDALKKQLFVDKEKALTCLNSKSFC